MDENNLNSTNRRFFEHESVGGGADNIVKDDLSVIDAQWVTSRFMIRDVDLEDPKKLDRYWSSANSKFTDTTLGGNIAINSKPQFTRYCDIRVPGKLMGRNPVTVGSNYGGLGMGTYYSEAIDDNAQLVHFEFGIPKFNSIFDFFSKSVSYTDSVLANTGRSPAGYMLGQVVGGFAMLVAFPAITIGIWLGKLALGLMTSNNAFNYYYMEPTMHSYWGTVNTMITNLATELGILNPMFMDDKKDAKKKEKMGAPLKMDNDDLDGIRELLPGLISDNNYIDVFAIATKAQTLANRQKQIEYEQYKDANDGDISWLDYMRNRYKHTPSKLPAFSDYLNAMVTTSDAPFYTNADSPEDKKDGTEKTSTTTTSSDTKTPYGKSPDGTYPAPTEAHIDNVETMMKAKSSSTFSNALDSGVRLGGAFAVFQVEFTGSVSESFSNSVGEIDTGEKMKSMAKKARDVKFSFSGGNVLGDTIGTGLGYIKDVAMGALDSVTFGMSNVLTTLMGGGYIDIPKKWEDSSVTLPQITYAMDLVSPYNNPISKLQNEFLPLFMILGGMLPQSVGKASYASPYLCRLFSKGIQDVALGMITSCTVTRGTSNLAFSKNRQALGLRVEFTVTDFSNIMSAPVNTSIFNELFSVSVDDDSVMGRYIATLASRDLLTSKYAIPKAKIALSRKMMQFDQALSPSSWGLRVGDALEPVLGGFAATHSLTGY